MAKFGLLLFVAAVPTAADIVFGGEELDLNEVFNLDYATDSAEYLLSENHQRYYCVFRSNWNAVNHPVDFPDLGVWSDPIMFSHTKQFVPALKDRAAPIGVEQIAEVSNSHIPRLITATLTNNVSSAWFQQQNAISTYPSWTDRRKLVRNERILH